MNTTNTIHATHPIYATDPARFLRKSLRGNAVFSALSGLTFAIASGTIAAFLGAFPPLLVFAVGVQLLVFAAALVWLASRPEISAPLAIGVIVADLVWVVATLVAVYVDLFTRGGAVLLLILADVVLLMAILQAIGVHRMGAARVEARS